MPPYPYSLPEVKEGELVELTDSADRPLLVVPRAGVRRFGLNRRIVLVALRDAGGKIYIQQRGRDRDVLPGFWDLSATGHVRAGEAREDAARRELEEEIGISRVRLVRLAEQEPKEGVSFSTLYLAGPAFEPPVPNPAEVGGGMFLDREELQALAGYDPDCVTPGLRWALGTGLLFR
jgi:isopentenyl-diphosphate delta-isomerase